MSVHIVGRCRIQAWCKWCRIQGGYSPSSSHDKVNFCHSREGVELEGCSIPPHIIAGSGARGPSGFLEEGPGFQLNKYGRWRKVGVSSADFHCLGLCERLTRKSASLRTLFLLMLLLLLLIFPSHCSFQQIVLISTHDLYLFVHSAWV